MGSSSVVDLLRRTARPNRFLQRVRLVYGVKAGNDVAQKKPADKAQQYSRTNVVMSDYSPF
jgi:hypothetical protein